MIRPGRSTLAEIQGERHRRGIEAGAASTVHRVLRRMGLRHKKSR